MFWRGAVWRRRREWFVVLLTIESTSMLSQGSFPAVAIGFMEYFLRPKLRDCWGGAFNNQQYRQRIFREIVSKVSFGSIWETGAFRGITTEYMCRQAVATPVFSVEAVARNYGFCKARFLLNSRVQVSLGDSRDFLRAHLPGRANAPVFVYLDAHWYQDLPLRDELDVILRKATPAVVMIDDFQVPDDEGYRYDDYGSGRRLSLDYLEDVDLTRCAIFFPKLRGGDETGSQRGCVVIATVADLGETLKGLATLRLYDHRGSQ